MMKYFLSLTFSLLCFVYVNAQMNNAESYEPNKALQLFVGIGGAYNNYKNLNNTLKDFDLPTVGKFTLASSMEADLRHNNFLTGLSGNMGVGFKRPDNYNVMLLNFEEELHFAYYVVNSKNFHFAPQVGIGYFSSNVNITQRKNIDDFNDVLSNGNSLSINQGTGVLDFCLRFDFAEFSKPRSRAGSIQLGYKYGLSKRGWGIDAANNSTIDNSPLDRINQVYLTFSAGVSLLKPKYMHKQQ